MPSAGAPAVVPVKPPRGLPRPILASFACRVIDLEGGGLLEINFEGYRGLSRSPTGGRAQALQREMQKLANTRASAVAGHTNLRLWQIRLTRRPQCHFKGINVLLRIYLYVFVTLSRIIALIVIGGNHDQEITFICGRVCCQHIDGGHRIRPKLCL